METYRPKMFSVPPKYEQHNILIAKRSRARPKRSFRSRLTCDKETFSVAVMGSLTIRKEGGKERELVLDRLVICLVNSLLLDHWAGQKAGLGLSKLAPCKPSGGRINQVPNL